MKRKNFVKVFFLSLTILLIFIFIYFNYSKEDQKIDLNENQKDEVIYNSNIIKNVNYKTIDADGNEYIINAKEGEIDYSDSNTIFLKKVNALIKLKDSSDVTIKSDFGKYNTNNYDTIFSKNVIINYLENKITGEYVDFSILRNSMIISRKVVYTNLENILKADAIEVNIRTKDTKIFMYEKKNKVNVQSKNFNGNN
tara:strand:- start:2686 stop:3276 length:591 start_codon:yes stop_codon:yes gene_type:complete